jgi:hypothetical protein
MADRPMLAELLDAVRGHLETYVVPALKGEQKLYFQTLVAVNLLRIAERELAHGASHRRDEWLRLNDLTGDNQPLPPEPADLLNGLETRNAVLCAAIRAGEYDSAERNAALLEHALLTTTAAVEIANPKLLAVLITEMGDPPT